MLSTLFLKSQQNQLFKNLKSLLIIACKKTKQSLELIIPEVSVGEVNTVCQPLTSLSTTFQNLNTIHKQNSRLQQNPFVAPVEIKISDKEKYVYIPVIETLKSLLTHADVRSHVFGNNKPSSVNIIENFTSSDKCKASSFFSESNTLQIQLYVDDFTLCNPLGTSAKKHKICAIYFTIGNIPYYLRSKLFTIQLTSLIPNLLVKKHGFQTVLKQFIHDMKILESDGLEIETEMGIINLRGFISMLISDNLAAHEIGGLVKSFSSYRRCRFCNATGESIQTFFSESKFELKTVPIYEAQLTQVLENPDLTAVYGVKSSTVLNELNHFHFCSGSASDIAHDLFEGLCIDLLTVVLDHCLEQNYFSIEFINNRISHFPYTGLHQRNKPASIIAKSSKAVIVKQTASQCQILIRSLPLLIAHKIPTTDSYWLCFTSFLDCLDYILSPSLHVGQIYHMKDLIEEFLDTYKNLNDTIHIKPKGHYLLHYASQYKFFGPLINQSTLRYEGKHSNLKSIFSSCKNFRNPCLSIATRHQYLQALHHMNTDFLLEENIIFSQKITASTPVSLLDETLRSQIQPLIHPNTSIPLKSAVEFCGINYQKDSAVIIGCDSNYQYKFGILEFDSHLHAYIIDIQNKFQLCSAKHLTSKYALPVYRTEIGCSVIILHHFFHQE